MLQLESDEFDSTCLTALWYCHEAAKRRPLHTPFGGVVRIADGVIDWPGSPTPSVCVGCALWGAELVLILYPNPNPKLSLPHPPTSCRASSVARTALIDALAGVASGLGCGHQGWPGLAPSGHFTKYRSVHRVY